jgi:hypothetical protein
MVKLRRADVRASMVGAAHNRGVSTSPIPRTL